MFRKLGWVAVVCIGVCMVSSLCMGATPSSSGGVQDGIKKDDTGITKNQADLRYVNEGQANSITSAMIVNGTIVAADIADGTITSAKLATGALSGLDADFLDGEHGAYYLDLGNATGTLDIARIADGSLTSAKIAADTIVAADIATGAVTTDEILDSTITSADIAADTIAAADIATGAVTTDEILDGTIAAGDLADGAALAEILDNDGTGSLLDADLLDGKHYTDLVTDFDAAYVNEGQADSITSGMIVDGTIVAADIATGAVTTDEILDGTVAAGDLADRKSVV